MVLTRVPYWESCCGSSSSSLLAVTTNSSSDDADCAWAQVATMAAQPHAAYALTFIPKMSLDYLLGGRFDRRQYSIFCCGGHSLSCRTPAYSTLRNNGDGSPSAIIASCAQPLS